MFAVCGVTEVLESDEDDIDEDGTEYLERLEDKVIKGGGASPFAIKTTIQVSHVYQLKKKKDLKKQLFNLVFITSWRGESK
jgi:hypothetical protein